MDFSEIFITAVFFAMLVVSMIPIAPEIECFCDAIWEFLNTDEKGGE